jgi:thiamine biosynthesis lipoprotein ApbE
MKKFEYTFKALGTVCILMIIKEDDTSLNKIINSCYNKIVNFENEFSRFKKDSFLNNLNRLKKLEASEDFLSLLSKSKEIYQYTL